MNELSALLHSPHAQGALALWLFSALLHTMPPPKPDSWTSYVWLYGVVQFTGSNLSKFMDALRAALPSTTEKTR